MKMFVNQKSVNESLKEALVRAIAYYLYSCWAEKNGYANQYTEKHKQEEWAKVYTLFSVACDAESYRKGFDSSLYLDERNLILNACAKHFSSEVMSENQQRAFDSFVTWICKGSERYNPTKVKELIHLSQFKYSLKENGIWKDHYAYISLAY